MTPLEIDAARSPTTITELLSRGFAELPDGPFLVAEGARVSRSEVDGASLRIATRLVEAGITVGTPCLVLAPLDVDGIVACLGALRSGAAVVSLDPTLPAPYVRDAAELAGAKVVVLAATCEASASAGGLAGLPTVVAGAADGREPSDRAARQALLDRLPVPGPLDVTRIKFTSGSTGRPKGVLIDHEIDLFDTVAGFRASPRVVGRRLGMFVPFGPGTSVHRLYQAVATNATVHPLDIRTSGLDRLIEFIDEHQLDDLRTPVGLLRSLTSALGDRRLRSVEVISITGEAISTADLAAFQRCFADDAVLSCVYGASETGGIAYVDFRATDPVPDGGLAYPHLSRAMDVRVEREDGSRADVGEVGQIVCRGRRVVERYLDGSEAAKGRLFTDPDGTPGCRIGDLGRFHPDGGLEVLGRTDDQVAVRGHNVHLGTVEAALRALPGVADCAVVPVPGLEGGTQLAAALFVDQAAGNDPITVGQVRRGLAHLPTHMVPQRFLAVTTLPRLSNGKLDRAAVAVLTAGAVPLGLGRPHRAPVTATERALAALFGEVLGVDDVGLDDDFFDLGGDSLAAEELVARLGATYGRWIARGAVLECPTVAALALRVDAPTSTGDGLVLLHHGARPGEPVFLLPGAGHEPFDLVRLAHRLGADRPVYSFRSPLYDRRGRPDRTVPAMAARMLVAYRRRLGRLPTLLAGYSGGAPVALEMAAQIADAGGRVALFASIDGGVPPELPRRVRPWRVGPSWADRRATVAALAPRSRPLGLALATTRWPRAWLADRTLGLVPRDHALQMALLFQASGVAVARYRGRPFAGSALVVVARDGTGDTRRERAWARWLTCDFTEVSVPGGHHSMLLEPHVAELAGALANSLRAAEDRIVDA